MVQLTAVSSATVVAATQPSKAATAGFCRQQRPGLPDIAPGQLWLVEISPEASELPSVAHRAFVSANVVIYDRGLGPLMAAALPLGKYAEPATASGHAPEKANVEHCVRFARDGWSVIRLVKGDVATSPRSDRLLRLSEQLLAGGVSPNSPVQLLTADGNATCEETATCLGDLDAVFEAHSCEGRLTAIFTIGSDGAPPLYVVANGLAG